MATLYQNREANIRRTWFLFTIFFVVIIGFGWTFSYVYGNANILYFAVIFSVIMSFSSYWFSDKLVLSMTKAREVDRNSHRELYNIVENLAITAGLPMPKLYIVPEQSPNAFATGRNPEHAVVAVTEGLLERLDRSELEGVLAHELSHIGNRDMLVSTVVVILVGFIAILSDIFLRSMVWGGGRRGGRDNGGGYLILIGIALSILAPIAATLIRLAISRKREFLADASGALLTRYPEGLASALKKISSDTTPVRAASNTNSHLWFDDPFDNVKKKPLFHKLFMTHPPVEERIKALKGLNI